MASPLVIFKIVITKVVTESEHLAILFYTEDILDIFKNRVRNT